MVILDKGYQNSAKEMVFPQILIILRMNARYVVHDIALQNFDIPAHQKTSGIWNQILKGMR